MSLLDSDIVDDLSPASATPAPSAPKAPAKKAAAKKAPAKKPAGQGGPGKPPRNALARRLEQSITSAGMGVALLSPKDGATIMEGSQGLAQALDKLAAENPKVQAAIERWLTAGAWSGVFLATLPIAIGIGANHGMIPEGLALLFAAAMDADDDGDT